MFIPSNICRTLLSHLAITAWSIPISSAALLHTASQLFQPPLSFVLFILSVSFSDLSFHFVLLIFHSAHSPHCFAVFPMFLVLGWERLLHIPTLTFSWTKVLFMVEWKIMEFSVCVGMAYPLQWFSISFIHSVPSFLALQENKTHLYWQIQIYLGFWQTWMLLACIRLHSSQFIRVVVTHA